MDLLLLGLGNLLEGEPEDEESNTSKGPTTDVWSYFERESEERARCAVCRTSLPNFREILAKHLKEKHPKLISDVTDEDSDVILKDEDVDDEPDDMYTEVIYLEEEPQNNVEEKRRKEKSKVYVTEGKGFHRKHSSVRVQGETSKRRPKRRESRSSEEYIVKKPKKTSTTVTDEDDYEIESFGKYITCLLKKLPRSVCRKLQMNIVNLIMSANLNEESNKIVETVPIAIQRIPIQTDAGTSYIMLNEKGVDAQNVCLKSTPQISDVQSHVNISISNSCDVPASTALSSLTYSSEREG